MTLSLECDDGTDKERYFTWRQMIWLIFTYREGDSEPIKINEIIHVFTTAGQIQKLN